ncbi:MAG: GGDEF domain-containing protein [Tepidisphaeraceae bacterium]
MVNLAPERMLVIGDKDRSVRSAIAQILPTAQVTAVASYFDAIAEMSDGSYSTVIAAAEPIERRPEPAIAALRELAGEGRVLLFGHPTLEPLSRKMLDFGCDDYVVTPVSSTELQQMLGAPTLRITARGPEPDTTAAPSTRLAALTGVALSDIVLDALIQHPHDAPSAALDHINAHIAPTMRLFVAPSHQPPQVADGLRVLSHALRHDGGPERVLYLAIPLDEDETAARHALAQMAHLLGKLALLQERHKGLETAAITDDLTGLYNGRYFRLFLARIIEKARTHRFPVTVLLFDIDNFKSYNDKYGHGVGDEILRQTANLIRRCVREHDKVCRISGDEFAVIFWEKEGPRQPREATSASTGSRVPQSVRAVCDRFRRLIASPDFQLLGASGHGTLTISGGLAVYPYDATTPQALIDAADRVLMLEAKKSGKNTIFLVGGADNATAEPSAT